MAVICLGTVLPFLWCFHGIPTPGKAREQLEETLFEPMYNIWGLRLGVCLLHTCITARMYAFT